MNESTIKSLRIFGISLSAPFLVWILLRVVAAQNPLSHDPNPWIQSLVTGPQKIHQNEGATRWVSVITEDQQLMVVQNGQKLSLEDFVPSSEKTIFIVKAQGPSLAKEFYNSLKDKNLLQSSLVLSASDGFIKDLRFYDPNVTAGCGQAYLVRWRALRQLGLERMMTITMSGVWLDPDVFGSSLDNLTKNFAELQVPVFIGPVTTEEAEKLPSGANYLVQ